MRQENIIIKIWKIIYPALVYYGITFFVAIIFTVLYAMVKIYTFTTTENVNSLDAFTQELINGTMKYALIMSAIAALITIPIIAFLYVRDLKKFPDIKQKKIPAPWYPVLVALSLTSCIGFNNMITMSNLDKIFPGYEDTAKVLFGGNIIIQILFVVILAPIVEELIFRGIAYRRIARYWNKNMAMLFSAIFFGIYHGNVVQGVYAFLLGMILAYLYDKFQTIKAPILAHASANLISVVITETTIFRPLYNSNILFFGTTAVTIFLTFAMLMYFEKSSALTYAE